MASYQYRSTRIVTCTTWKTMLNSLQQSAVIFCDGGHATDPYSKWGPTSARHKMTHNRRNRNRRWWRNRLNGSRGALFSGPGQSGLPVVGNLSLDRRVSIAILDPMDPLDCQMWFQKRKRKNPHTHMCTCTNVYKCRVDVYRNVEMLLWWAWTLLSCQIKHWKAQDAGFPSSSRGVAPVLFSLPRTTLALNRRNRILRSRSRVSSRRAIGPRRAGGALACVRACVR